jgi:hypothetical protein
VSPERSSASERVSETVSTAMESGTKGRLVSRGIAVSKRLREG